MSKSTDTIENSEELIDDSLFAETESDLEELFADWESEAASSEATEADHTSVHRVEQILQRAKVETVVSDSAAFVFDSFGAGLAGVTDAIFSTIEKRPPRNDSF